MEFENLLINTKNNITTISINRPKNLNALNIKTLEEIANAINLSIESDKTKCIIITIAKNVKIAYCNLRYNFNLIVCIPVFNCFIVSSNG